MSKRRIITRDLAKKSTLTFLLRVNARICPRTHAHLEGRNVSRGAREAAWTSAHHDGRSEGVSSLGERRSRARPRSCGEDRSGYAPARSVGLTMVWGGRLSVARRSLNGAGVETRTGCRASRCRGPLRLPRAAVPVARGPTRQARRRRP